MRKTMNAPEFRWPASSLPARHGIGNRHVAFADGAAQSQRGLRSGLDFVGNDGAGGGVELPFGGAGRSGHGSAKGFEVPHELTTLKNIVLRHG
jgi:acyl-CoA reductase-like NAD-dependent aldehyde dehydrogenase